MRECQKLIVLSLVIFLSCPVPANAQTSDTKKLVINGTTTLPSGQYTIVNRNSKMKYTLDVDSAGKMKLDELRRPLGAATSAAPPASAPVAQTAPTTSAPPAVPQQQPPAGQPGATTASASGQVPGQPESTKSKIQSSIKREAERQLKKHGGKIEGQVKDMLNF